nr:PREDICTED: uncharacterized protein LOC108222651 isoform X2 [Daucus carota subsp. sativus]
MDPGYIAETSRHLEKQNELLWETYRSMSHELQKLQVEEEMLMRKFYEVMSAHGLTKKTVSCYVTRTLHFCAYTRVHRT